MCLGCVGASKHDRTPHDAADSSTLGLGVSWAIAVNRALSSRNHRDHGPNVEYVNKRHYGRTNAAPRMMAYEMRATAG